MTNRKIFYKYIYLFCWFLFMFTRFVIWTNLSDGLVWIFQIGYVFIIVFQICIMNISYMIKVDKVSRRNNMFALFLMFCSLAILCTIRDTVFLIMLLFILNSNLVKMREFITFDIKIKILFIFTTILLYALGFVHSDLNKFYSLDRGFRYDLGFGNPNVFAMLMFTVLIEIIFLTKKHKWFVNIISIFIGYGIFAITDSRTSFYTYIFITVLLIVLPLIRHFFKKKVIKGLLVGIPVMLFIMSIVLVESYHNNSELAKKINEILSGRLYWANNWLEIYKYTLLGTKLPNRISDGLRDTCLDMGFIHTPLMYGYLGMFCFLSVYTIAFKKILMTNQYDLFIYALSFLVMGFGEAGALIIPYNIPLIFLMKTIMYEKNETYSWIAHITNRENFIDIS